MIPQPSVYRIFEYTFRPMDDSLRTSRMDEGFCLSLTNEGRLTITHIARGNRFAVEEFAMPPQLLRDHNSLLAANDRLYDLPCRFQVPAGRVPRFWSQLCLSGFRPFELPDLAMLAHLPMGDPTGRSARLLMVFFEDVMELFHRYGVALDLTGVMIDYSVLTPLANNNMNPNWMNTVS